MDESRQRSAPVGYAAEYLTIWFLSICCRCIIHQTKRCVLYHFPIGIVASFWFLVSSCGLFLVLPRTNQKLETRKQIRGTKFFTRLLCAITFKDSFRAVAHRRICGTEKMVRINDDVDAGGGKFSFCNLRIGGGHHHERLVGRDLCAETFREGKNFIRCLALRRNQNAVRSSFKIGLATGDGIIFSRSCHKGLTTRNHHEIIRISMGTDPVDELTILPLTYNQIGQRQLPTRRAPNQSFATIHHQSIAFC